LSNDVEGDVSLGDFIVLVIDVGDRGARKDGGGANMLDGPGLPLCFVERFRVREVGKGR
jgi:hypothetical protein